MAKHAKRKKKPTSRRRRRSVGAMALNPTSPLVQYGSIALGFLMGGQINTALEKVIPANVDGKIVAAAEVGLGALLAFKKGGKKSLLTTVGGGVLIGAGVKKAMAEFGIGSIGGYQMVPAINGYSRVPTIGAPKRIGGYMPGKHGMNGYSTNRSGINGIGNIETGGLLASDMLDK